MPLCQGCGASYDDNYKFCPHCGRAKPEPESINLNVRVALARYEEAVLKIEVVGTTELTEPPFHYGPGGLASQLGQGGRNWKQFTTYRLLVDSHHPETGQYIAHQSANFGGFNCTNLKFPGMFTDRREFRPWVERILRERKQVWDETNRYLTQQGWVGITENATKRQEPFSLAPTYEYTGRYVITFDIERYLQVGNWGSVGSIRELTYLTRDYRYRRVAS